MKKLWRIVVGVAVVCMILGVVLIGAGFFTGGSPVSLQNHGDLALYLERLAYNRDILLNEWYSILAFWGL